MSRVRRLTVCTHNLDNPANIYWYKHSGTGKRSRGCKLCRAAGKRKDYWAKREAMLEQQRRHRLENRETILARKRQAYHALKGPAVKLDMMPADAISHPLKRGVVRVAHTMAADLVQVQMRHFVRHGR